MSRAERQMVSALTIKLPVVSQHGNAKSSVYQTIPVVSQHGNAKSSVWQYFGKLHHDYVDDILKYWSVQSSSNNMPILCQLAELYLRVASSSVPVNACFPLLRLSQMANALV